VEVWPAYDPAESGAFHPFGGPPPKSEGTAWQDPRVTEFVAKTNLPNLHAIRDLLAFPDHDLVFFTVIYGSPADVYPSRTGLRFGTRIGWMDGNDSLTFRFRPDDNYLQGELIDTLLEIERGGPANDRWPYPIATQLYLPLLVVDPAVRITVVRRCARMMYTDQRGCAVGPVRAAASQARDWETLTLLSFRGADGYGNDAWAAQDTLAAMALELFKDRSVPPATWAAVTWSLGRYHTTKARDSLVVHRILAHPTLGKRLDILTPLVSLHFAFMADEVADRIPGSDSTRAAMRQVLRYPWGNGPLTVTALRQAVRTKDRAVLTVLANLFGVSQGIRGEAARHLPAGVIRRYDTYREPPALR